MFKNLVINVFQPTNLDDGMHGHGVKRKYVIIFVAHFYHSKGTKAMIATIYLSTASIFQTMSNILVLTKTYCRDSIILIF